MSGRVVVAEGDPTVSEVVARYLTRAGFTVRTVADGRTAAHCIIAAPPDLVVLDLMLPGLDGSRYSDGREPGHRYPRTASCT